uniref:Uncharacterized protein n=1 Tax=viral metagenome TaxID=1070528 RepID=A0A6C0BSU7_9ZZZZ
MKYTDKDFLIIKYKSDRLLRNYNYNCFDLLKDHLPTDLFYSYFLSRIEYKLKNIWNNIVINWIQTKEKMKNNSKFKKSIYFNQNYNHYHKIMKDEELNNLINCFINNDKFKGIYVIKCILKDLI